MGTTVTSQRIITESILSELRDYGCVLRKDERTVFEEMLKKPYLHFGSISNASSINAWALIIMSILLEQEKRIRTLEGEILEQKE